MVFILSFLQCLNFELDLFYYFWLTLSLILTFDLKYELGQGKERRETIFQVSTLLNFLEVVACPLGSLLFILKCNGYEGGRSLELCRFNSFTSFHLLRSTSVPLDPF